jgi:hypothetical protein
MPQIGDTVWVFDGNRRVYRKPEVGRIWASGGPIYREHFRPMPIIGETKQSWVIGHPWQSWKVNKKTHEMKAGTGYSPRVYFTQAEVDDDVWVHDTRPVVCERVVKCVNADVLRQIVALLDAAEGQPTGDAK